MGKKGMGQYQWCTLKDVTCVCMCFCVWVCVCVLKQFFNWMLGNSAAIRYVSSATNIKIHTLSVQLSGYFFSGLIWIWWLNYLFEMRQAIVVRCVIHAFFPPSRISSAAPVGSVINNRKQGAISLWGKRVCIVLSHRYELNIYAVWR